MSAFVHGEQQIDLSVENVYLSNTTGSPFGSTITIWADIALNSSSTSVEPNIPVTFILSNGTQITNLVAMNRFGVLQ